MTIADRFVEYDNVDASICVIKYEPQSTIVYCNRFFAGLLSTHPDKIQGRSLDELTISDRLHFDEVHPLLTKVTKAVGFLGGFCIKVHDQYPMQKKLIRVLKVYRVEPRKVGEEQYLIGFVRRPTRIELLLNRTRLDTNIDFVWKPAAGFLLAGKWRPWATVTFPVWGPVLMREVPVLFELIQQVL